MDDFELGRRVRELVGRGELTIRRAQKDQPWKLPYSPRFTREASGYRAVPAINHATLHLVKASGKIAAILEEFDHDPRDSGGRTLTDEQFARLADASADVLASVLRIANVASIDLESALRKRAREKNGAGYDDEGALSPLAK